MTGTAGYKVFGRQWCDCYNKNVLAVSSKVASDCEVTTSAGRLFHRRGAAAQKARSPAVLSRVRRTISLRDDADRSHRFSRPERPTTFIYSTAQGSPLVACP